MVKVGLDQSTAILTFPANCRVRSSLLYLISGLAGWSQNNNISIEIFQNAADLVGLRAGCPPQQSDG